MKIFEELALNRIAPAGVIAFLVVISSSFGAPHPKFPQQITILHTNDLHSHFRESSSPLHLGGIARIKTAVDQVRKNDPAALLVDGGDWSEGDIYYTEGQGAESLRMMDRMGYDVAVIGNHDWINGPDVLLDSIKNADARVSLVSANVSLNGYARGPEFNKMILPYVIKKQGDVKIAFIGLSTYEFIFDRFFAPIKITEPFLYTRYLSNHLKSEGLADIVVAISHNSVFVNQGILRIAPAVDLIIGGHDHKKLIQPVVITRSDGTEAWIVETGSWGEYLGRVDLTIDENKRIQLLRSQLTQIDSTIPEDSEITAQIEKLEAKITGQFGPIFSDQIGESQIELKRLGQNSGIGNLITDAFYHTTGADFSMDSTRFIYGELHPGVIRTVDAYNANPAVYDPQSHKAWSIKILPVYGKTLQYFLNTLYASKRISAFDLLNVSGLHLVYDPVFSPSVPSTDPATSDEADWDNIPDPSWDLTYRLPFQLTDTSSAFQAQSIPSVSLITIQGQPLDPGKLYHMATGGGLLEGIRFYNSYSPFPISLEGLVDTGLENWRVLADYIHVNSPLTPYNVPIENRIQTLKPDLAIFYEDIQCLFGKNSTTEGNRSLPGDPYAKIAAEIKVRIKNYGTMQVPAETAQVRLYLNKNGINRSIEPQFLELTAPLPLKGLNPNEDQIVSWNILLPQQSGSYEITAKIEGTFTQVHTNNLEATRSFKF